ncbi:MAG TPA: glycosyltransferase family 2 protein [Armatimonadetes bacterium]|nr:glycosyltransferase family 2 protein [Armatimonadota bacterium]
MHDLAVIIVNWNSAELLCDCLASIYAAPPRHPFVVVVVDNASQDDSVARVRAEFPQVHLLVNSRNLGFAAANNRALREVPTQVAVLLNPDCRVQSGSLDALVDFLLTHPEAGAVGPRLTFPDGRLQPTGTPHPTLKRFFLEVTGLYRLWTPDLNFDPQRDYGQTTEVEVISGACLAVRREVLQTVGLLDEGYFLFYEDLDWCLRMRQAGWKIYYLPRAQVIHDWGGTRRQAGEQVHLTALSSAYRYFRQHHGPRAAAGVQALLLFRETVHLLLTAGRYAVTQSPEHAQQVHFRGRAWHHAWQLPAKYTRLPR